MTSTHASDDASDLAAAMMDAARNGDRAALAPFLDAGAPLDMQDADGNTMLMLAAYHGHAELVRDLAARGASVDLVNDRGAISACWRGVQGRRGGGVGSRCCGSGRRCGDADGTRISAIFWPQ